MAHRAIQPDSLDYLRVDRFIASPLEASLLEVALTSGLIDRLAAEPVAVSSLTGPGGWAVDSRFFSVALVVERLEAVGILRTKADMVDLTVEFRDTLRFRDLIEAKLTVARLAAADVAERMQALIFDALNFERISEVYQLWDYRDAGSTDLDAVDSVRPWAEYAGTLSRYEWRAIADVHDFRTSRALLDVGGCTGEFCLGLLPCCPSLEAAVYDRPALCELGRQVASGRPGASRLRFLSGDAINNPLPVGFDTIVMKTFLHDWDDATCRVLLGRAVTALEPGARVVIAERSGRPERPGPMHYCDLPMFFFGAAFGGPRRYVEMLQGMGDFELEVTETVLDTPWFVLTATLRR